MQYPFAIRRATRDDREAMVALALAAWPEDYIPHVIDDWLEEPEPFGLYVAEQDGKMIGMYHLEGVGPGEAYFSAMRMHPGAQGKGLGSLFCRAQIEQARSLGFGNLYLLSKVENLPAHRTVQKNGFQNLGEWIVYDEIPLPALPAPQRVRTARADDAPHLAPPAADSLGRVICPVDSAWDVKTVHETDLDPGRYAVVENQDGGLSGILCYGVGADQVVVRRLEGTPEAAADLLAFAADLARRRGLKSLGLGLPARVEHLLKPLGLAPAEAFRSYVFLFAAEQTLTEPVL